LAPRPVVNGFLLLSFRPRWVAARSAIKFAIADNDSEGFRFQQDNVDEVEFLSASGFERIFPDRPSLRMAGSGALEKRANSL
jgi:hypothetical protein